MEYKKFYEMDIWKEAYDLQNEIFKITRRFPTDEKFGIISQILNSSNSVPANIAESHGRFYFKDKIRVLYTVRGEIEETQSHLIVSVGRGYLDKTVSTALIDRYEKLKMKINNTISDHSKRAVSE